MTWFKVDDKLHDHRKTRRARKGGDRPRDAAAMGLWVLAGSWCASNETDGFVPADELDGWDSDAEVLAQRLVDAGYWHPAAQDGEDGYQFHEWETYQPTRAQLEAKREGSRERMRAVRANREGTARVVRSTPTRPDPTNNNTTAGAADPEAFDTFWGAYPKRVGKAAAAKAYAKAVRDTTPDAIMAGLANAVAVWRATETDGKFIPHPATWLNQGRWADEVPLPDMPQQQGPGRPVAAMQCPAASRGEPHDRHPWTEGRNDYHCHGVTA